MRPLSLTMQAFGSYGKQTTIDFEAPNQNIFLITGDTGAGKTTIFDAIVFALYGEASSGMNKKDGTELQSQFVNYELEPFVELTFSEGMTDIYTVRRIPRHIRLLKKGSGVKEDSETVSLRMPDGTEYPQKETDKKLEEIVGLTKSQFMQVAMIAQGEFIELLRAKSDDKKVIFRKLFHTELYQKIVDELGRRKKEKQVEIGQIRTICQTEVGHILIPEEYEKAELLAELKRRILRSDRFSVTDMESLLEELQELRKVLDKEKSAAQKAYREAGKERDTKRDACTGARNLLKLFDQFEQARKILEECEAEEEEMLEAGRQMTQIHDAYEIQAVFQRYIDAEETVTNTKKTLEMQRQLLPRLMKEYQKSAEAERKAKQQQEQELEAYTKTAERVEQALDTFRKLTAIKEKEQAQTVLCAQTEQAEEHARKNLNALETKEIEWRRLADELKDAQKALALWKVQRDEADSIGADLEAVKRSQRDVEMQRKQTENAQETYAKIRARFAAKNEEYLTKHTAFLDAQAGLLAKEKLRPGQPCPVCGSLEHPQPCVLPEDHEHLTREMIGRLAEEVRILQADREEKARTAGSGAEMLEEKEKNFQHQMEALWQRLRKHIMADGDFSLRKEFSASEISVSANERSSGEHSLNSQNMDLTFAENVLKNQNPQNMDLKFVEEILEKWKKQIQDEGEKLQKNADILTEIQTSLQGIDEKKRKLKTALEDAIQLSISTKNILTGIQATRKNLEGFGNFSTEKEAVEKLHEAAARKKARDSAWQEADQAAKQAKTAKETAEALIVRYEHELPMQEEICSQRYVSYAKLLEEKALTETEWKALVQNYLRSDAANIQKKLDAHRTKKASAEAMKSSAKEAIGNQPRPVIAELETAAQEAEQKLSAAQNALEKIREEEKADTDAWNALAPRMEERSRIMELYRKLEDLYALLAGKVTGSRMDIETYVQRYYLERILYAANRRFHEMSSGQFELRMYDLEKAGEGKNHGLDLMVYSTVTGKEREVRTLSGGESFMAALSLALGMADQIQENTAAVNLEMMFIDEGFGSLDERSRGQAVRVLREMAGGSRLIGIISHVSELKQEIEDQLLVTKDENGSHTRWQIS